MNSSQWSTVGVIVGIILGIITAYFLARSSARESARLQSEALDRKVNEAKAPLLQQISDLRAQFQQQLTDKDTDLRDARARIDSLEDELRRGRGYGGDSRAGR